MKKLLPFALIALLVSATAAFFLFGNNASAPQPLQSPASTQGAQGSDESQNAQFSAAQVAERNSKTSCWTIINNGVYDITQYIARHPGGEDEILKACGKDATALFTGADTNGRAGGHSGSAESQLSSLRIGSLK